MSETTISTRPQEALRLDVNTISERGEPGISKNILSDSEPFNAAGNFYDREGRWQDTRENLQRIVSSHSSITTQSALRLAVEEAFYPARFIKATLPCGISFPLPISETEDRELEFAGYQGVVPINEEELPGQGRFKNRTLESRVRTAMKDESWIPCRLKSPIMPSINGYKFVLQSIRLDERYDREITGLWEPQIYKLEGTKSFSQSGYNLEANLTIEIAASEAQHDRYVDFNSDDVSVVSAKAGYRLVTKEGTVIKMKIGAAAYHDDWSWYLRIAEESATNQKQKLRFELKINNDALPETSLILRPGNTFTAEDAKKMVSTAERLTKPSGIDWIGTMQKTSRTLNDDINPHQKGYSLFCFDTIKYHE